MNRSGVAIAAGLAAATLTVFGLATPAFAHQAPAHHAATLRAAPPLPAHVSAPYVDVTEVSDLAAASAASGSKYLSLAFLQTQAPGSCTVYWAGDTSAPVATTGIGAQVAQIRRHGGDVIPSFGGYSADTTNTELADSCTDVHAIAREYERVVTVLNVHRIDFDIEADSINSNPAGIDRRNQALAELMNWAKHAHRSLQVTYTLPSTPQGLAANGMAVLNSAVAHHAPVFGVNVMTFDYWDGATHDMVKDAETAAAALVTQMHKTIAPHTSSRALWHRVGIIQMNGIDDYGTEETFTAAQAKTFVAWAVRAGLSSISFWALQRDNGDCPGTVGSNVCSGVEQAPWAFSRTFARFNSRW